jgi:hypothetical protein
MWTCPKCGRSFTRPGQSHSCGSFSVSKFLEGKPAQAVQLYRGFEELVAGLGHVLVAPAKTRIGFQNRRIFAAVNRIGETHLDIHIVTASPIHSHRVRRIEQLSPSCSLNHLRVRREGELDCELAEWLRRGYEWGRS